MAVPRSVKLYRFHSLAGMRDVADAIARAPVSEPSVVVNNRTHRPEIVVDKKPGRGRISGAIRLPYRLATEAGELLGHSLYRFLLSNQPRLAVVQTARAAPVRVLAGVLGDRSKISEFEYDKGVMDRIVNRMLKTGAILHDPRFEFVGAEGYDGLARSGFTPVGERCATTRKHYRKMLDQSSRFEPVLRVYQAGGICEEERPRGILLKIKRDLTLSMYTDVTLESWVTFVERYVVPEIATGTRSGRRPRGS